MVALGAGVVVGFVVGGSEVGEMDIEVGVEGSGVLVSLLQAMNRGNTNKSMYRLII